MSSLAENSTVAQHRTVTPQRIEQSHSTEPYIRTEPHSRRAPAEPAANPPAANPGLLGCEPGSIQPERSCLPARERRRPSRLKVPLPESAVRSRPG